MFIMYWHLQPPVKEGFLISNSFLKHNHWSAFLSPFICSFFPRAYKIDFLLLLFFLHQIYYFLFFFSFFSIFKRIFLHFIYSYLFISICIKPGVINLQGVIEKSLFITLNWSSSQYKSVTQLQLILFNLKDNLIIMGISFFMQPDLYSLYYLNKGVWKSMPDFSSMCKKLQCRIKQIYTTY